MFEPRVRVLFFKDLVSASLTRIRMNFRGVTNLFFTAISDKMVKDFSFFCASLLLYKLFNLRVVDLLNLLFIVEVFSAQKRIRAVVC